MKTFDKSERILKWKSAFEKDVFQKQLQQFRNEIESIIIECIQRIKRENNTILMFDSVESRIKSADSFVQKLSRKNYIDTWELQSEDNANQEYILQHLPDVIGFRVSCYFKIDEKILREKILEYKNELIELDPKTNTKQANGHDIYKIKGVYKKKCNFEIQVKSLVHNVWGEVEHRTIYKSKAYDFNSDKRKEITEGAYSILTATDRQLTALFEMGNDRDKMIKGLFYEETKDMVAAQCNTDILGNAYDQFYSLFYDRFHSEIIKYVANTLLGKEKKTIEVRSDYYGNDVELFKEELFKHYYKYEFQLVESISNTILSYYGDSSFYGMVLSVVSPKGEEEPYDDEYDFSEESDENDELGKTEVEFETSIDLAFVLNRLHVYGFTKVDEENEENEDA